MSCTAAVPPRPALLTSTSMPPNSAATVSMRWSSCAWSVTSHGHRERPGPGAALDLVGGLGEAALVAVADGDTRALLGAARRAVAKPMPVPAAAVTSTERPESSPWAGPAQSAASV